MFFHYVRTESGKQVDPLILGRLSVEATQNVYNPERFTAEYLKAVANLGTVNQIAELMFNGNIEAAQKFVDNYADADIRAKNLAEKDNIIGPSQNTGVVSPMPQMQSESNAVQNIDEGRNAGYNDVTTQNNEGGNESVDTIDNGGFSRGDTQSEESNTGGKSQSRRTWTEDASSFIQRATSEQSKGGRGRQVEQIGNTHFAYTPKEADGSQASLAIEILNKAGINAVYCEGNTESNVNGITTVHSEAVTAPDGTIYVSSSSSLSAIHLAAHEAVHSKSISNSQEYLDYEAVVCDNILWGSDAYVDLAKRINDAHYNGKYDVNSYEFGKAFIKEVTAYVNEFISADVNEATEIFAPMFSDWGAVVEASRKFNEAIGLDFSEIDPQTVSGYNSNTNVNQDNGGNVSEETSTDPQERGQGGYTRERSGTLQENLGRNNDQGRATRVEQGGSPGIRSSERGGNRNLTSEQSEGLKTTAIKNEDGTPKAVYHFTENMEFDVFAKGDIGFHFGNETQATARGSIQNKNGRTITAYLDIKNPLNISTDIMSWRPRNLALKLLSDGIISVEQYRNILKMDSEDAYSYDDPAAVELRRILAEKGYDGIVYQNMFEGDGESYIAFYPEQVIIIDDGRGLNSVLQSNANEAGKAPSNEASPTGGRVLDMPAITVRQQNYIRQVGKALGLNVEFVNMEKFLREHDVNTEGLKVYPDGAIDGKGNVYIAYNTKRALQFVFKHELTHFGERSKHYKAFVNVVRESKVYLAWLKATTKMENASREVMEAELMKRHREARNGLAKLSYDAAMNEIIADFVGEKCFGENLEDINELVSGVTEIKEKNAAVRFLHDFFLWLKNKLADHQLIRDEISLIEQNFAQMLADTDNTKPPDTQDGGLKYSIASDVVFSNYCDSIDKIENSDDISSKGQYIEVSQQTPSIIVKKANAKNLPMAIQFDIAYLETRHDGKLEGNYHSLGANNMKELPKLLETPEYIVRLKNGRLNVIVEMSTKKGERALVSIELEQAKQVNGKFNKYNLILTAFGTKTGYLERIVNNPENQILYDRKTEPQGTDQLHKGLDGINGSVSNNRVTQNNSAVNSNSMQNGLKYSVATDEQTDTPTDFPSQQKELFEKLQNGEISGDEYAEEIELLWEKALEEAGEIKPGEKVSAENKDIPVPKSVKEGTKVRQHVRTILESGMATAQQEEWLKAHVLSGELSYTPTSDKKRIKDAENTISKLGYQIALNNWQSRDGGGLGLERIVQNILGLDNIKQATAFPRDRDGIRP